MNQVEFEALASTLLRRLYAVADKTSLVRQASLLLGAEVGVLVDLVPEGGVRPALVEVHPPEEHAWVSENISVIRGANEPAELPIDVPGYAAEKVVTISARQFADSMVAWGGAVPRAKPSRYELLLLGTPATGSRYTMYHCWAANALLQHLEYVEAMKLAARESIQRKKAVRAAATERACREEYADTQDLEILRREPWANFTARIRAGKDGRDGDSAFLWRAAAIWTAYRVRDETAGVTGIEMEGKGYALKALTDSRVVPPKDFPCESVIKWLIGEGPLDGKLAKTITSEMAAATNESWPKIVALALEHGWRVMLKEARGAELAGCGRSGTTPAGGISAAGGGVCRTVVSGPDSAIASLLDLTLSFFVRVLDSTNRKREGDRTWGVFREGELDRTVLHLYFGQLLGTSAQLRGRYLGLEGNVRGPDVPPEARRGFTVNLCRFVLGIVEALETRLSLDSKPAAVSQREILDSLLHLVDRYAHVELAVDERLRIRELLGHGLTAEVYLHLTQPSYRDHLLHVVDVFLLGHLLLSTEVAWLDGRNRRLLDHLSLVVPGQQERPGAMTAIDWLQQWAVASLLHDLGYQLGRKAKELAEQDAWREFFRLRRPIRPVTLDPCAAEESSGLRFVEKLCGMMEDKEGGTWLPTDGVYPLHDHGVLAALRVAQVLLNAASQDGRPADVARRSLEARYQHALHAIAHHNLFAWEVSLASHPLACLLRLCDELQEWGRRRVNIERMVKQLYLNIEAGDDTPFVTHESLERIDANVEFRGTADHLGLRASVPKGDPVFCFRLLYRDQVEADFDATTTFLSKAFNLQHLGLTIARSNTAPLRVSIELHFPRPVRYGSLSEYDIYGLFTEQVGAVPLLSRFDTLEQAEPGLVLLSPDASARADRLAIVVSGPVDRGRRKGWLPVDPGTLFEDFIQFKSDLLRGEPYARLAPDPPEHGHGAMKHAV